MTTQTITLIEAEITRANAKHGSYPLATDADTVIILVEELGEYAQAVLQRRPDDARMELIQLASVAINHLENTGPHVSPL